MKKTFWKIYFWFLLVTVVPTCLWQGFPRIWEVIDVVLMLVAMSGLVAFCWQKRWFSTMFWKIFLGGYIVWNIFQQYILPWPQIVQETIENDMGGLSQPVVATINIIIFIPLFVALYLYAFKNEETKKQ
ncbi:MAG: hypothetical protein WC575_03540 [Patescibacteria group bacterium]